MDPLQVAHIDITKQKELIEKASKLEEFNNEEQIKSREIYELNNKLKEDKVKDFINPTTRPIGYCKSHACKIKHDKELIHSIDLGPHVLYHCLDCLSDLLVKSRDKSTMGLNINVEFNINTEGGVYKNAEKLFVKFMDGNIYLNDKKLDRCMLVKIEDNRITYMKYKLVIMEKIYIGNNYLIGNYTAFISGRYICKSILHGLTCNSMSKDYVPQDFISRTILPGVPGWKESHEKMPGKITIFEYCPACSAERKKPEIKPKFKSWSTGKQININYEEKYIKLHNLVNKLLEENNALKKKIIDLESDGIKRNILS